MQGVRALTNKRRVTNLVCARTAIHRTNTPRTYEIGVTAARTCLDGTAGHPPGTALLFAVTASRLERAASIALFRAVFGPFVATYWRPKLVGSVRGIFGTDPCFIYGNHCNRWDPFILNSFSPWSRPTAGVMTQEFFRKPFLSWALRSLDLQPTRKRIAEPGLVRAVHRMIDAGHSIVIYPEGGSRWAGRPEPWIEATAKIFVRSGLPVYPVVMNGSYVTWPRWADHPRPGRVEVEILEPIVFDRQTPVDEALARLKALIAIDENSVPNRLKPRWAFRPAAGIERLLYRDPFTGDVAGLFSKDGRTVRNRAGSVELRMCPDSSMVDERTGEVYLTGDLYDRILAMPFTPDKTGALRSDTVDVLVESDFPKLVPLGTGRAALHDDGVRLTGIDTLAHIAITEIRTCDVERNFKLQLFLGDSMVQFSFVHGGSALGWRDALRHLTGRLA